MLPRQRDPPPRSRGLPSMPDAATPDFSRVWDFASEVSGWLTEAQAQLLWDVAAQLSPAPLVVEIGSHQGRSTIMLASVTRSMGGRVVAVDPFVDGRLFGGCHDG